jgi:hypothetical protein
MSFAPQLRALFRHLNLQKWIPFNILTSKSASRHSGRQCLISHLPKWLRTCRFGEPTFRPSRATKQWKKSVCCGLSTFPRTLIIFLLTLSLLILSLL